MSRIGMFGLRGRRSRGRFFSFYSLALGDVGVK
jgi:hypothetical protein